MKRETKKKKGANQ